METGRTKTLLLVKITLSLLTFCVMSFCITACTSEPDPNDGKCDICGKAAFRYQLGDGAEYCKEHFGSAAAWYLN